jgi:hypothetical protein
MAGTSIVDYIGDVSRRFSGGMVLVALPAVLLLALPAIVSGQRPYFDTPPPGAGPTPMEPYGESGGCSEDPVEFHRCALAKAEGFEPPRLPDGTPDFQGYWTRIVARNMENIEEHPEGLDGSGGKSVIVDPPDGRVPYQPWAAARKQAHFATYINPVQNCLPDAPPKHAYSAGSRQIIQTPGSVLVLGDYAHTYRVIPTDGRPHLPERIRLFMGDSRGRWEGNTLVVDVTNQRDRMWLDHIGNFYSDAVHVVERWTMFDVDVIHYEATIDDPGVYTQPWTMAFGWRRNSEPGYEIWENACWEGVSQGPRFGEGRELYRGVLPN